MKKFIKFFVFAIIFCVTSGLKNIDDQSSGDQEFIEKIQYIKSISADFTQTEGVNNNKNIPQKIIKGKLKLARPNKFLWEIESPVKERQIYVTDGKKYWHYDIGLEQVVVDDFKLDKIMNSPLAILLDNPENITKNYKIEKSNKNNTETESYKLIAKTTARYIQYIEICFVKNKINNKKNNFIKQINFTLGNSKNIIIKLDKVLVNQYINNNLFILKPPKSVDIINSNELM